MTHWVDILEPGLDVVFVGFNPSIPAWTTGHYYANPANRFYTLLHESGLTPHKLLPAEDRTLPSFGIGATDLVAVPSVRADVLAKDVLRAGVAPTREKLVRFAPRAVCCNGLGVYALLIGGKPERLGRVPGVTIGASQVFCTPSTSGLVNGQTAARRRAFRELARWVRM